MTPPLEPTRGLAEIFSAFSDAEATRNVLFRLEQHAPATADGGTSLHEHVVTLPRGVTLAQLKAQARSDYSFPPDTCIADRPSMSLQL